MLTLERYKRQTSNIQPFNEQVFELDRLGEGLTTKRYGSFSWRLENRSEATLSAFAQQALKSGKLPAETQTFTKTDLSFWTIRDGVAHKESSVSYKVHQLAGQNEVTSQNITKNEFDKWNPSNPRFEIHSSNISHLPYPHLYSGHGVIKYFRDIIQSTAPHLIDLMSIEWRYEGIHLFQEDQVNFILEQLAAKGFTVEIQAPYIIVDKDRDSGKFCIYARQSISVRIPDGLLIEKNAVYENHHSYKKSLSVHNALVAWRDTPEKVSLSTDESNSKITVEELLEQISEELNFVGSQDSLIKRYAFRVDLLDSLKQQELLEGLKVLGYNVTLDTQFIHQQFVGILNGFYKQFSKQYILIDLP